MGRRCRFEEMKETLDQKAKTEDEVKEELKTLQQQFSEKESERARAVAAEAETRELFGAKQRELRELTQAFAALKVRRASLRSPLLLHSDASSSCLPLLLDASAPWCLRGFSRLARSACSVIACVCCPDLCSASLAC